MGEAKAGPKGTFPFMFGELEKTLEQLASYIDRQVWIVGEMVQMEQKYRQDKQEKGSAEGGPRGVWVNG